MEGTADKLTVGEDFRRVFPMPERAQEGLEDGLHPSCGGGLR